METTSLQLYRASKVLEGNMPSIRNCVILAAAALALSPTRAVAQQVVVSEQLELVVADIESIMLTVEDVAGENSVTYESFVQADPTPGQCSSANASAGRACFHPANSFRVLTQYLFYAQIVEHSSFAFVNLNQPLSQSGDVWGFSGWAQDRAGVRYSKTLLLHVCMYSSTNK